MANRELLTNFVPFPRSVLSSRRSGSLTPNEYDLYMFTRHGANPFGVASVSLEALEADFGRRGWEKNYINKLLLSLRSKRYLHYLRRSGRRGTFEIFFPEFLTPTGHITGKSWENVEGEVIPKAISSSEVRANSTKESPKSANEVLPISEHISKHHAAGVRTPYTDTENIPKKNRFFEQSPNSFNPNSYEEERCKEMALALGETSMGFLLGTLHKHGFPLIEHAWGIYRDDVKNKNQIENKAAYFNRVLSNLLEERK